MNVVFLRKRHSPRFSNAVVTALALVCTYLLAFYWNLDKPYWAGFTVFMISLPTLGESLFKGLLRMAGTFLGAGAALLIFGLLHQHRLALLAVLCLYLCLAVWLSQGNKRYGYIFFISSMVTVIIVLMAVQNPDGIFELTVYRSEETLLGIGVYTLLSATLSGRRASTDLTENIRTLSSRHAELLRLNWTSGKAELETIYAAYTDLENFLDEADLLLPAAQLENPRIWRHRRRWAELLACSRKLAVLERRWAGICITLIELNASEELLRFQNQTRQLRAFFNPELASATCPQPSETGKTEEAAGSGAAHGLQDEKQQFLFARQRELSIHLQSLLHFLLEGGDEPRDVFSSEPEQKPLVNQLSSVRQTLLTFWSVVPVWILLHPPGPNTMVYLLLGVLISVSAMPSDSIHPGRMLLTFCVGSLTAGILYICIYPLLNNLALLMGLLFSTAFAISFVFHTKEQALSKTAYLMPWLTMSDFTNLPVYEALPYLSNSITLLLGVSQVMLIRYLFFSPNYEALFLRKQNAFFNTAAAAAQRLQTFNPQRRSPGAVLQLHCNAIRLTLLSEELVNLSSKLDPRFLTPSVAGYLTQSLNDATSALLGLFRLRLRLPYLPPSRNPIQAEPPGAASFPSENQALQAVRRSRAFAEAARQALQQPETKDAFPTLHQAAVLGSQSAESIEHYLKVARSADWSAALRNRF